MHFHEYMVWSFGLYSCSRTEASVWPPSHSGYHSGWQKWTLFSWNEQPPVLHLYWHSHVLSAVLSEDSTNQYNNPHVSVEPTRVTKFPDSYFRFACSQKKMSVSFVRSVGTSICLSVCPCLLARLPSNRISWHLILETFVKILSKNSQIWL